MVFDTNIPKGSLLLFILQIAAKPTDSYEQAYFPDSVLAKKN